jgi:uncharacterized protein (TIGR03382 family)
MLRARLIVSAGFTLFVAGSAMPAMADFINDGSTTAGWSVDRYPANSFVSTTVGGQPALAITISSADDSTNRPAGQSIGFYDVQGYTQPVNGALSGTWNYSGSLYLTSSMIAGTAGPLGTSLWAETDNNPSTGGFYLIDFLSGVDGNGNPATGTSVLGVWNDVNGTEQYFPTTDLTTGWNNLSMVYNGTTINYYDNGNLFDSQGSEVLSDDPNPGYFSDAFVESYNYFGESGNPSTGSYTVDWSNLSATTAVPEPASAALIGLPALALLRRRRRA